MMPWHWNVEEVRLAIRSEKLENVFMCTEAPYMSETELWERQRCEQRLSLDSVTGRSKSIKFGDENGTDIASMRMFPPSEPTSPYASEGAPGFFGIVQEVVKASRESINFTDLR